MRHWFHSIGEHWSVLYTCIPWLRCIQKPWNWDYNFHTWLAFNWPESSQIMGTLHVLQAWAEARLNLETVDEMKYYSTYFGWVLVAAVLHQIELCTSFSTSLSKCFLWRPTSRHAGIQVKMQLVCESYLFHLQPFDTDMKNCRRTRMITWNHNFIKG